ncbi:MAG: response regulator [Halodesulfovibrio sp.]|uniref:response regulator n=1 Tax=Halodesulfovibrio sp. TaxID=1912772 RepID=UPI00359CCFA3
MRVLIIEDDGNKLRQIEDYLNKLESKFSITHEMSYQSGLKNLATTNYDLILLDMSLPTFDTSPDETGGPFLTYAGIDILREIDELGIDCSVIIITQYESFEEGSDAITLDQLCLSLEEEFKGNYIGAVYYRASETNWKQDLLKLIEPINKDD